MITFTVGKLCGGLPDRELVQNSSPSDTSAIVPDIEDPLRPGAREAAATKNNTLAAHWITTAPSQPGHPSGSQLRLRPPSEFSSGSF